jgi:hypothetical protein
MKVGFQFDIDDLIDVHRRMTSASPTFKAIHRSTLVSTGAFIAVLAYWLTPGSVQERLIYAAAGAAAWCAVYPFIRRATLKSRLRSYWKEHLEGEGPFTLEVELSDQGVLLRQFRTETLSPWSMVKSVEEKDGAVEIAVLQGGFIVVRDRAFATAD